MSEPVQLRQPKAASAAATPTRIILQAKIIAVAVAMEPLIKRDQNPDQGWSFVSIDDYYEKAAKRLLEAGVSWVATEEDFVDSNNLLRWRFRFDVFDTEGNWWEGAGRVTVPHDFDGPQTAGKVVSYAEKVFLRQLLKLVTGEPDADISGKSKNKRRGSVPAISINQDKVRAVRTEIDAIAGGKGDLHDLSYDDIIAGVKDAPTETAMNAVIEQNKPTIARMGRDDPDVFKKLAEARTKKLKEFETDV